jgi:hypothetical protein
MGKRENLSKERYVRAPERKGIIKKLKFFILKNKIYEGFHF